MNNINNKILSALTKSKLKDNKPKEFNKALPKDKDLVDYVKELYNKKSTYNRRYKYYNYIGYNISTCFYFVKKKLENFKPKDRI